MGERPKMISTKNVNQKSISTKNTLDNQKDTPKLFGCCCRMGSWVSVGKGVTRGREKNEKGMVEGEGKEGEEKKDHGRKTSHCAENL